MLISEDQLKKLLVEMEIISLADFAVAKRTASRLNLPLEKILVEKNIISEDNLLKLVSDFLDIPYINLDVVSIPRNVISLIPQQIAREKQVVIFGQTGNELKVAMVNPKDMQTINYIRKKTGFKIKLHLTSKSSLRKALIWYRKGITGEFKKIIEDNVIQAKRAGKGDQDEAAKLPVIKIFDTILQYAFSEDASDIHIEPLEGEVLVRYRIDGILHDVLKLPIAIHQALIARIKVMAKLRIDEHRKAQDGRFKKEIDSSLVSVRVSIIPAYHGEKAVLRILFEDKKDFSLEELGLTGNNLEKIEQAIRKPNGMILATGPTGSGKTTTLYSIINTLNSEEVNICTIEDPIEYSMDRVNQTQVNPKAGYTFASGLRSLLRQDPDIIMVGEIRDTETAKISVHSALTGHLVLSTLHTNDAAGTLPRLLEMGIEPYLIASTVNIAFAQRLVRKICQNCIKTYSLSKSEVMDLNKQISLVDNLKILSNYGYLAKVNQDNILLYKGEGCEQCNHTGYKGRIAIFEILEMKDNIRELVTNHADADRIKEAAIKNGMITMLQDGILKVINGETTLEEVLRVTK